GDPIRRVLVRDLDACAEVVEADRGVGGASGGSRDGAGGEEHRRCAREPGHVRTLLLRLRRVKIAPWLSRQESRAAPTSWWRTGSSPTWAGRSGSPSSQRRG